MKITEFTFDDIEPYIEQKLPGFKPRAIQGDRGIGVRDITLRVESPIRFAMMGDIPGELLFPLPGSRGSDLRFAVDQLIDQTRYEAIQKLGLQEEIDKQVERQVQNRIATIRREEFEKAYKQAMADVVKREEDRAGRLWNAFMGREPGQPIETHNPFKD